MGLLDYYRQFEGMSEDDVNSGLRERAAQRRNAALARLEPLDLATNTWPHLPHPYVVNAVTYVARRGLHRYIDRDAGRLRSELAHHVGVEDARLVVGNGAAELMRAAMSVLLEPGQEVILPWPSYPLLALMARQARGHAVPVDGYSVDGLLSAVNDRTRIVAICSPNDPTGERLPTAELRRLVDSLGEEVAVLLDEALIEYSEAEPIGASTELLETHPRLIVLRSFSKAWGLAGLRIGYAIGGPGSEPLLERLEPELGVNDLAQAGALESLRSCAALVAARGVEVGAQRRRLATGLRDLGLDVSDSQANFVWFGRSGLDGSELARALERKGIRVAHGAALGDRERVRAAVHDAASVDRLLREIQSAL